jgi:LAGLIDADG-like domain
MYYRMPKCVKCQEEKFESEFYRRNKKSPSLQSFCKKCANKDCRERARHNRLLNPKTLGGQRRYTLDEAVFKSIDTEQKAYWLGFLYADGYNGESRSMITLGLAEQDKNHLEGFKKFIGSNAPIKVRPPRRPHEQNMHVFNVCSKKMCNDLSRWGCMQAKTFKMTFPKFLDKSLLKDFIRGYFDGDGSVGTGKCEYGNSNFTIVSNIDFLIGAKEVIEKMCGINTQIAKNFNHNKTNVRCLSSNGNIQVFKFLQWIYADCSIALSRKFEKYMKLKNYLLTRIPKRGQKSIALFV